jgi:GntR family transcriptional regulator, transcriptional repressor for pyruvate dehydrogenase complex
MRSVSVAKPITRSPLAGPTGFGKVFAFLRDQILDGTIRSGDRLVPERELAVQLGVSRPLVREALRALSMMGVVEIRSRVGTIVRRPDVSVLGDFFALTLAQQADMVDDVMEARIAIECQAIRLACRRATTQDFERIKAALACIASTIGDAARGAQADFDFHEAVVRAAKSETLGSLYDALGNLLLRSHRDRRELVDTHPGIKGFLVKDHQRIFEAIVSGDEEKAEQVLRKHFGIGDRYRHRLATRSGAARAGH